jgi:predicted esterase
MRIVRELTATIVLFTYMFVGLPLMLAVGRTRRGRAAGFVFGSIAAAVTLPLLVPLLGFRPVRSSDTLFIVAWVVGGVWLTAFAGCGAYLFATSRRYVPNPAPGLWSISPAVPLVPTRWRTGGPQGPPETDLIRLGVAVVTRLDPLMSRRHARQTRRAVGTLMAEMDADPGYARLYPPYMDQLRAFASGRSLVNHGYAYTPSPRPDRPGVLVFLHGHGPNTALSLRLWRDSADRHGLAVFCPTFGYGNWDHPDGVTAVRQVLDGAAGWCDPTRVYLAGISQGGVGVLRAAVAMPDRLTGLILLSPATEPAVVESLAAEWRKPVFVAQGGQDHNVRPAPVSAAVERLRTASVPVTYHFDPDADHALAFTHRATILHALDGWLSVMVR